MSIAVRSSDGCTGLAIKNELLKEVEDFGLDLNLCRGQGYNGAGTVSGIYNDLNLKKLFLYIVQLIG